MIVLKMQLEAKVGVVHVEGLVAVELKLLEKQLDQCVHVCLCSGIENSL